MKIETSEDGIVANTSSSFNTPPKMKIKTSELQGAALDWAVAKCERIEFTYEDHPHHEMFNMHYSTDWAQGGSIIEREIARVENLGGGNWAAYKNSESETHRLTGPTPLIAAMRCFVASKLGDTVEIPEELK